MGGLHAGIYLQNMNMNLNSIIVEKNNYPGGYVSGFTNNGFYFDSAAEAILEYEKSYAKQILQGFNFKHHFIRIEPLEGYYNDNKLFKMYSDVNKFIEEIKKHHPDQVEGVKALIQTSNKIRAEIKSAQLENKKITIWKILKVIFKFPTLRKYATRTFKQLLEEFITDEKVYEYFNLFCLWFGLKFEEIKAPIAAHIISSSFSDGMYYPQGGMGTFAEKLANHFIARGGTLKYQAEVKRIIIEKKRAIGVELKDGTILYSNYIISNGDLHRTVFNYVGKEHFNKRYLKYIQSLKSSISGYMLYLGVSDLDLSKYPPHFLIGNNTKIIPLVREEKINVKDIGVRIASNIDPNMKKGNKDSITILGFADYQWNDFWQTKNNNGSRTKEYKQLKNEIIEKLLTILETIIPKIKKHVIYKRLATPHTFEKFNLSSNGAWYGPQFNQKLPSFKSPIKNLFFAGSNVGGSGINAAMTTGIKTGQFLIKKMKKCQSKQIYYPVISSKSQTPQ